MNVCRLCVIILLEPSAAFDITDQSLRLKSIHNLGHDSVSEPLVCRPIGVLSKDFVLISNTGVRYFTGPCYSSG